MSDFTFFEAPVNIAAAASKLAGLAGCGFWPIGRFATAEDAEAVATALNERNPRPRGLWVHGDSRYAYSPFVVQQAPAVGDPVSYAFNGDSYPCGYVSSVSASLALITTSTGHRFHRSRKRPLVWLKGGTWSLVYGHVSKRNPEF